MLVSRLVVISLAAVLCVLSGCGGDQSANGGVSTAADRGKTLFLQCRACHSLGEGGPNRVGPNLFGIFGSKAGIVPGFSYSDVMANSDLVWTTEAMDEWLKQPSKFMPGNRMIFFGIPEAQDRADLMTYLRQETGAQ